MAYKRREDGRFRLRASFDIPAETVEGLNTLSERTGLSTASLCLFAVQRLILHAGTELLNPIAPDCSTGGGGAKNPPSSGALLQGGTAPPGPV